MFAAASSLTIIWIVFVSRTKGELEAEESITGLITFPGRQDLPNDCRLQLELHDITSMNDTSDIVGSMMLTNVSSFPISFELFYNSSKLVPDHQYSMMARIIESNGNLLFVNDQNSINQTFETTVDMIYLTMMKVEFQSLKNCSSPCIGEIRACPYGYRMKDDCEICECNDPCRQENESLVCNAGQRCIPKQRTDGEWDVECESIEQLEKVVEVSTRSSSCTIINPIDQSCSSVSLFPLRLGVCNEPPMVGVCRAAVTVYFYNPKTQCCETFTYGGCGGNGNNFRTKEACEAACMI